MRPRSILVIAIAIGAIVLRCRGRDRDQPTDTMAAAIQPAVLRDGFAVGESWAFMPVVREVDRDGTLRFYEDMPVDSLHSRVVGTSAGTALAWLEDQRAKFALIDEDGELGEPSMWGSEVNRLCDGVASSNQRFGIGWQEPRALWLLHGPVQRGDLRTTALRVRAGKAPIEWCGIASADDLVALFWREDAHMFISMCANHCSAAMPLQIDADNLLAFGCVRDGCAIAYVDHDTQTKLGWFTASGELVWTKPLGGTGFAHVSIANAGPRAVVASFRAPRAPTIFSVTREGMVPVWTDPDRPFVPAVVWSDDVLLIAHRSEDLNSLSFEVMPLAP